MELHRDSRDCSLSACRDYIGGPDLVTRSFIENSIASFTDEQALHLFFYAVCARILWQGKEERICKTLSTFLARMFL